MCTEAWCCDPLREQSDEERSFLPKPRRQTHGHRSISLIFERDILALIDVVSGRLKQKVDIQCASPEVAPLAESVPPKLYGGTERVVSWLTEELVRQGHDVTLFASGGFETPATFVAAVPQGLRLAGVRGSYRGILVMLNDVLRRAGEFDIIHFHIDLLQFPLFQHFFHKCVTTLHGRLDLPDVHPIYRAFPEMPLVSISGASAGRCRSMSIGWRRSTTGCRRLFFLQGGRWELSRFSGRIAPEKRPDRAIEIAKRAQIPLKIAAKVDPADQEYFERVIEPLLDHPLIEFVGEIGDEKKDEFLGNALALLFPIDWPEPFGLVMIEAMSTGTPVIAWRSGFGP